MKTLKTINYYLFHYLQIFVSSLKTLLVVADYQLEKKEWYQIQKQKIFSETEPSSPLFVNFIDSVFEPE